MKSISKVALVQGSGFAFTREILAPIDIDTHTYSSTLTYFFHPFFFSLLFLSHILLSKSFISFIEFSAFGIWALAFWFGSLMVDKGRCDFGDMFKVLSSLSLSLLFL